MAPASGGGGAVRGMAKQKVLANLQMLRTDENLGGAVLVALGAFFLLLSFTFYPLYLVPILALAAGAVAYKNPPLGTIVGMALAFPAVAYQAPVLAWVFSIALAITLFEAFERWSTISFLQIAILAPFAPFPFSLLSGFLFLVLGIAALRFGSRHSFAVSLPAVFIVMLLSTIWLQPTASFITITDSYSSLYGPALEQLQNNVRPEVGIAELVPETIQAVLSLFLPENIRVVTDALMLLMANVQKLFIDDFALVQLVAWAVALFLCAMLPPFVDDGRGPFFFLKPIHRSRFKQTIASLVLFIIPITNFLLAPSFKNPVESLSFVYCAASVGIIALMEQQGISLSREKQVSRRNKQKTFGKFGVQDMSEGDGVDSLADVGGYEDVKFELRESIIAPIKQKELTYTYGIKPPTGILFFGPPGTGKTLLMKALAKELDIGFYYVKCSELLSEWYGESLPYDEKITIMEGGRIRLEEIGKVVENRLRAKVLSFGADGKAAFADIGDYFKHECTSPIYEVRTRTGRHIRVTGYHSLFTLDGCAVKSVKTSELVPGISYIAIPSKIPCAQSPKEEVDFLLSLRGHDYKLKVRNAQALIGKAIKSLGEKGVCEILGIGSIAYLRQIIRKNIGVRASRFLRLMEKAGVEFDAATVEVFAGKRGLPGTIPINGDFALFLGLFVAEGSYNAKHTVRISTSKKEVGQVSRLCLGLFGSATVYEKKDSNGRDIYIGSRALYVLMRHHLGLKDGAENKKAPEIAFSFSDSVLSSFLRGYFSGDGCVYANQKGFGTVEASTVSSTLANHLLYLLLRFGIVATVYGKDEKHGLPASRICMIGEPMRLFSEKIGFTFKEKSARLSECASRGRWHRGHQIPITGRMGGFVADNLPDHCKCATAGAGMLSRLAEENGDDELSSMLSSDIFWDRVEKITRVNDERYVYDISVEPCQNFAGGFGGIFAHNSEKNVSEVFTSARKNAPCVSGDTLITLDDGSEITVEELFENPKTDARVLSMDSQFRVVPKRIVAMQRMEPKDIVEVTTSIGSIRCTPDHRFPVLENGRLVWTEAKGLNGRFVATPRIVHVSGKAIRIIELLPPSAKVAGATAELAGARIRKTGIRHASGIMGIRYSTLQSRLLRSAQQDLFLTLEELEQLGFPCDFVDADKAILHTAGWGMSVSKPLLLPERVDEELCYALGLLWSDGHFEKSGRRLQFSGDHPHLHDRLKQILEGKFGVFAPTYKSKSSNCFVTKCSSRLLAGMLQNLQARLLTLPENLIAAWLRGVFDGDGHITADASKISVGATKKGNRKLLQKALLRVGIPTVDHKGNSLELSSSSQKEVYLRKVGFEHPAKVARAQGIVFSESDSKSRLDVIPVGSLLSEARTATGLSTYNCEFSHSIVYGWEHYGIAPSRERVAVMCRTLKSAGGLQALTQLKMLADSDIFWAKVTGVRILDRQETVYDLQVEGTENFMANGMFVHNCVLFFDEIDSIGKRRDSYTSDDVAPRIMSVLLQELDGFRGKKNVITIGATNIPDQLDPALMRPGRFDKVIYMPLPDIEARKAIFKVHLRKLPTDKDIDFDRLGLMTERYSGADIKNICTEASRLAAREAMKSEVVVPISMKHLTTIVKKVKPSVTLDMVDTYAKFRMDYERRSEAVEKKPDEKGTRWEDVAGLEDVRKTLLESIEIPLLHEDLMKEMDVKPSKGLLLFGPPGCGKTMIIKAAANELNANFLTISGSELMRGREKNPASYVKEIFNRARESAPALVFIDEIEALAPSRDEYRGGILTELLQELDGVKELKNVMLIGATNKPSSLDAAILRPGRFDKILYIPPPDEPARKQIFANSLAKFLEKLDLGKLASATDGFSGADVASICQEVKMQLVRDRLSGKTALVTNDAVMKVIKSRRPSITQKDLREYFAFMTEYGERK